MEIRPSSANPFLNHMACQTSPEFIEGSQYKSAGQRHFTMNYYFLDVSAYTALKNNAENEAVDLIQKFHRFVISDEDLKPLVEFLTQQIDRINRKHKRCTDIRFNFKEGYSEGNWIFEFCDSYKISFRLISKGMEKLTNGQCLSRPEWALSQLTLF